MKKLSPDIKIAVVIPSYRVRSHILKVLSKIGAEVQLIYVVDDCCPEGSGAFVTENCNDPRVRVLFNNCNEGVGGAVITGYRAAVKDGADIVVKIDGDGQMSPGLIPYIVHPICSGKADYSKGNRFYNLTHIQRMPKARLIGNAILSFMAKFATGYWKIFDPTNGYTAIDARIIPHLPLESISKGYFFETDLLFRLNIMRALVVDVPIDAVYKDEESSLEIKYVIGEFMIKHFRNLFKRIIYNYYLRDMSLASLELIVGSAMVAFGFIFGSIHWYHAIISRAPTPLGTIMLAALPVIAGIQLLLAFFAFDIASSPAQTIGELLTERPNGSNEYL